MFDVGAVRRDEAGHTRVCGAVLAVRVHDDVHHGLARGLLCGLPLRLLGRQVPHRSAAVHVSAAETGGVGWDRRLVSHHRLQYPIPTHYAPDPLAVTVTPARCDLSAGKIYFHLSL